jgi:selenide,water dikinase
MLPGYVSGFYSFDECHIDLAQLSRYAGAALVQEEATGIDIKVRRV